MLKSAFPNYIPAARPPFILSWELLNLNWISGFVAADGMFTLNYIIQEKMRLGATCQPHFKITQHQRDAFLLERIAMTLGCGIALPPYSGIDRFDLVVTDSAVLFNVIIPFFTMYPQEGSKRLDFEDFAKGVSMIKAKQHLTTEGLKELKRIAHGMNSIRIFYEN